MTASTPNPDDTSSSTPTAKPQPSSGGSTLLQGVIGRIISGVLLIMPPLVTVVVIYYVGYYINAFLIQPLAIWILPLGGASPYWTPIKTYVTPPIALVSVVVLLYFLGYLFQTRIHTWVNKLVNFIPGVSRLYRAIHEVVEALRGPDGLKKIDTVVIAPFPYANARAVGYLMGENVDAKTGERLACVYIPIGMFPPSGYTLVYPWNEIIVTDWDAEAPWKVLLSGGLTLPTQLPFTLPDPETTEPETTEPDAAANANE